MCAGALPRVRTPARPRDIFRHDRVREHRFWSVFLRGCNSSNPVKATAKALEEDDQVKNKKNNAEDVQAWRGMSFVGNFPRVQVGKDPKKQNTARQYEEEPMNNYS